MEQLENAKAAIANLNAVADAVIAYVASLPQGSTGVPVEDVQALADGINAAAEKIKSIIPAPPVA